MVDGVQTIKNLQYVLKEVFFKTNPKKRPSYFNSHNTSQEPIMDFKSKHIQTPQKGLKWILATQMYQ